MEDTLSGGIGSGRRDVTARPSMTIELKDVETHEQYEFLLNEIEIMKKLDHPNIARVQEVFHTPDHYYMVMDLYTGGDMYARYKFRSEDDTAKIVNKLINALRYCHDRNVAHRDIKLENICFESMADDAEVKLVDFGLSASFKDEQMRHDLVGSWAFMAPEVLQRAHHPQACDLWSMGVVTYCLLAGFPPFRSVNLKGLKDQIMYSKVSFEEDVWKNVSDTAKDFILKLLRKDPRNRLTAQQAQQHPWLSCRARSNGGVNAKLSPKVVENLMLFKNLNLMKRVALGVVARTLEASEMRTLEQEFHKADITKSGVISIEDFRAILLRSNQFQRKEVDEIFDGLNTGSSNLLSYTDFTAAALDRQTLDKRRLKYAFERLDHDNNGELDYEDLMMTVGSDLSTEDVRTAIKQFDPKGNGKVTFDDFCKGMRSTGGALDALSTAQLTSGYMVESIAKGEGVAAIQTALTELDMKAAAPELLLPGVPGVPEAAETLPQVDVSDTAAMAAATQGAGATAGAVATEPNAVSAESILRHSTSSSSETAAMSRPHSMEQDTRVVIAAAEAAAAAGTAVASVSEGGGGRSVARGESASVGGGAEATAPTPRKWSKEVSPVGGGRAEAARSTGGWVGDNGGGEPLPVVTMDLWGEGMRVSLADRRMRDSIRLRGGMGGLGGAAAPGLGFSQSPVPKSAISSPLDVASRHTPSLSPKPPTSGDDVLKDSSSLASKGFARSTVPATAPGAGAGTGPRGIPLVVASGGALGAAAASGKSGGEPAERHGSPLRKKPIAPAADLPPKDSTAGEADLGWGSQGLPPDLAAMERPSSEEATSSGGSTSGTGSGGRRTPKSLRFRGVTSKNAKKKGGKRLGQGHKEAALGGRRGRGRRGRGADDVYRNYDCVSSDEGCGGGSRRNGKRTGTFCMPGNTSGINHVPFWVQWMEALFGRETG